MASRYEELFGTPERVARTLSGFCADCHGRCVDCCVPDWITNGHDALLEWLGCDVTDERYTDLGVYASGNLRDDFENWVSLNLKAMAYDLLSPNPFKTLEEKKEIVEKYKRDIVDVLLEWPKVESNGAD